MNPSRFEELEGFLRGGQIAEARSGLRLCLRAPIAPADRVCFARLLCRAGLVTEALALLRPYVQAGGRTPVFPSLEEQVEYAGCLIRLGDLERVELYLQTPGVESIPQHHLYRAMAQISQWNYAAAIPSLMRYGELAPNPYQRYVAKVNLVAALIFTGDELRGEALLSEVMRETSLRRWVTLHANALELGAEYFILRRRWAEARRCLESSTPLLRDESWIYRQLLMKWDQILRYMTGELDNLDELREYSRRHGLLENLRECDRFTAMREKDAELAARLFFGTPFDGYRRKLTAEIGVSPAQGSKFLWHLGPPGAPEFVLDLSSGAAFDREERCVGRLKVGQLRHRVLCELSRDFYRCIPATRLAVSLYRDERCPETFLYRIHEAVGSTRSSLRALALPLRIASTEEGYRLESDVPFVIRVCESALLSRFHGHELQELRRIFRNRLFSSGDGARVLRIPKRTISRILSQGWEHGHLEKVGNGRFTRYRFP